MLLLIIRKRTTMRSMVKNWIRNIVSLTLSNLYSVLTTNFVFSNMRYISGYVGHASTLWLCRIYLLGEGYVIPVCVRVIQIFTVTERVSG